MKIKYSFNNGEIKEVEVSEEIGAVIEESRRKEAALAKKEQRHCYSLDAVTYEGMEYGEPNFAEGEFDYGFFYEYGSADSHSTGT